MSDIIDRISQIDGLFKLKGVSADEVKKAKNSLGVEFSEDFTQYLHAFGCISFGDHEFTGLGVSERLNVVSVTMFERKSKAFLKEKYVIETCMDGEIIVAQDHAGTVYEFQADGIICKKHSGLLDYVQTLLH